MAKRIRGVMFEENLKNSMGLEFYNLSHRFGYQSPNWPYFEDVKIERIHYMAKSGVLSQRITTSMHNTTHIDAPAHVVQGTPFIDEVPLPHFFGSGIVVSIPKKKWEVVTPDDLEAARPEIRPGDIVIVNTASDHIGEIALVANPKSNIHKVQDLVGKKATFTGPKSTSELLLRLALKEAGVAGKVEMVASGWSLAWVSWPMTLTFFSTNQCPADDTKPGARQK